MERSLEADVGDAFVVVATGENTSPQQHLVREFCVVRHLVFLALLKPVQVNEQAVALDVHLCEDLRHAVRKQIRILGDDEVNDARLEKEGKLSVALVWTDDVLDVLHSELLDEVVDHLTTDGKTLDIFLVCLGDTTLLEELLGLLLGVVPDFASVRLDP